MHIHHLLTYEILFIHCFENFSILLRLVNYYATLFVCFFPGLEAIIISQFVISIYFFTTYDSIFHNLFQLFQIDPGAKVRKIAHLLEFSTTSNLCILVGLPVRLTCLDSRIYFFIGFGCWIESSFIYHID